MTIRLGGHEYHIRRTGRIVDISKFILIRGPKVDHIVVTLRSQQLSIHGRGANDSDLPGMADDLLNLEVGMFLGWVIIEERFEFIDEVMILIGYF